MEKQETLVPTQSFPMPPSDQLVDDEQGVIDPEVYFQMNKPPANLPEFEAKLTAFVDYHQKLGNRLVFITSGGTTVPLENQTVRFIDNFSNGNRGAASTEYFLEAGYAVVFLHRQFSVEPFHRHFTHNANTGFLDYLSPNADGSVSVKGEYASKMHEVLEKYQKAKSENKLLFLDFVTLADYLYKLKSGSRILARLEDKAMYYLAAAVSDFFIPSEKMAEHKIQSRSGALTLTLDQVPKFLKPLVSVWASKGMIVSFKLETDTNLLVPKARQALTRYGHQVVVANMLNTRKQRVTVITKSSEKPLSLTPEELAQGAEIESQIIPELVQIHNGWIKSDATEAHSSSFTS
ncbi:DNA/pantothenate metabolism flavoprotein [Radiomyces spectabilis]|uniref:DNA/pantothenate metabolism flavoprotein n=1 Tax=Radiomyces spectabilis TaxID=64574 RepID=UPI00221E5465|nr:DNA/pantothenate metabolism flavoprotein [Radiomyces spectabilis]KAI8374619.1 DNA/pantothenate metabolism flavoprotein [Radiomyces spectabilis]